MKERLTEKQQTLERGLLFWVLLIWGANILWLYFTVVPSYPY